MTDFYLRNHAQQTNFFSIENMKKNAQTRLILLPFRRGLGARA